MSDPTKVMIAGHICLDISPVFLSEPVSRLSDILSPGHLVQVGPAAISTGGAVANTGLAMDFFGADVKLVAKIGQDAFGQVVREILDRRGRGSSLLQDETAGTSYSVVLAVPGLDRLFLHDPGANNTFCAADIDDSLLADVRHFHFGYPPLMKRFYENDGQELVELFRRVKSHGITTSLDMAAFDPGSAAGRADWRHILSQVLPHVDFFLPSAEEICGMLDRGRLAEWAERAGGQDITNILDCERDIRPLADELLAMGARVVLIKCGAPGMFCRTAQSAAMAGLCQACRLSADGWSDQSFFEPSFRQPDIVSATGAGDTSIAAFLTAMLRGMPLRKCTQLAAAAGAACLSAHDALSGLLPLNDLQARIDSGWERGAL